MSPEYIKKWIGHLHDIDPEMSRIACEKLARTRDAVVIPELARALRNRPVDVRTAAARALGQIGDPTAVPALVRALQDLDVMVSTAAADALGEIGAGEAVPALREVLHNFRARDRHAQIHGDSRGLYMAAVYALQRIGTKDAKAAIAEYDRW